MKKSLAEQHAGRCVHFNGIQNKTCKLGIDYRTLVGGDDFGWAARLPCLKDNGSEVACDHCRFPTQEEAAAYEAEIEAYMERKREDMEIIGAAHTNPAHHGEAGQSFVYVCELCDRAARVVTSTALQIRQHLQSVHGVDLATIQAARGKMAAHLDATDWSQTDDRFSLPDGRAMLLRSIRTPRRGANKAIWMERDT